MTRCVAFLRGINVGGRVVKMDRLRAVFEGLGAVSDVTTFIASGNVLFSSSKDPAALEKKSGAALRAELGYDVAVFIRPADEVFRIADYEAFDPAEVATASLFVGFLPDAVTPREKKIIASLESPVDALVAHKREIYWRASKNFSGAIFQPAKLEKALGKPATFRNITTVRKIAALLTA